MEKVLLIEGWRFLAHSYAVVNQYQILSLARNSQLGLRHHDAALSANWKSAHGLMSREQEKVIASVGPLRDGKDKVAARYRINYPLDFSLDGEMPHFVFATSEFGKILEGQIGKMNVSIKELAQSDIFRVVTPSNFSKKGFLNLGLREDQISVIPHGVSHETFRPADKAGREKNRRLNGLDGFVFANISALTPNKGIDILLPAFARVARRHPSTKLLLKGSDMLYNSGDTLKGLLNKLTAEERDLIIPRLIYVGGDVKVRRLAGIYQSIDAYVSPFRAEAFNLPLLEAAASGVPVIYTGGGPADEFLDPAFHTRVESTLMMTPDGFNYLAPNQDDLVNQMLRAIEEADDRKWRAMAFVPSLSQTHSWTRVSQQLLDEIVLHAG